MEKKGVMDFEEFEEALKKYYVYLPVKEIQAIMKCHNKGDDRHYLVDYASWVNSLKLPLSGRRLLIVQESLVQLSGSKTGSFTVGTAKAHFGFDGFNKWCEYFGVDAKNESHEITGQQFLDFYADISMAVFDDQ